MDPTGDQSSQTDLPDEIQDSDEERNRRTTRVSDVNWKLGYTMPSRMGGGTFKPVNTLNKEVQSKNGRNTMFGGVTTGFSRAQTKPETPRTSATNKNGVESYDPIVDVLDWPERSSKRQKTGNHSQMRRQTASSDDEEMLDNNSGFFVRTAIGLVDNDLKSGNRPSISGSQNSTEVASSSRRSDRPAPPLFAQTESRSVDERLGASKPPRPRKTKDSSISQQSSKQPTPSLRSTHGTKHNPVTLDDDSFSQEVDNVTVKQQILHDQEQSQVLVRHSLEKGNDMSRKPVKSPKPPDHGKAIATPTDAVSALRKQESQRRDNADKVARATKIRPPQVIEYERQEQRLADRFKRDISTAKQPQQTKAWQRMQATSGTGTTNGESGSRVKVGKVSPIDDMEVDELDGSPNIGNEAPHIKSSLKQGYTPASARRQTPDPSDIQRQNFHSSKRAARADKHKTLKEALPDDSDSDDDVFPISSLFMRACQLNSGEIYLHPFGDDREWRVEYNEEFVQHPLTGTPLVFGQKNVKKVQYGNWTSCKVLISGPRDDWINEGPAICIEFQGREVTEQWLKRFRVACGKLIEVTVVESSRMEKVFENTSHGIMKREAQRPIKQAAEDERKEAEKAHRLRQHRARVLQQGQSHNERIRYEHSDSDRENAQQSMQAYPSERESRGATTTRRQILQQSPEPQSSNQYGEVSKYFEPRRSTREKKPIRLRSLSPPPPYRWSQHNEIPLRYPVVYPATGAKRVTVDPQDIERLDEGEFLNDNVIGFALRYLEEQYKANSAISDSLEKVHFFNTFFYTALTTTRKGTKGFNYDAVKRWTKSVDLLEVPFVVVPINVDLHWFVAIICNLDHIYRKPADSGDDALEIDEQHNLSAAEQHDYNDLTGEDGVGNTEPTIAPDDAEQGVVTSTDQAMAGLSIEDIEKLSEKQEDPVERDVFTYDSDGKIVVHERSDEIDLTKQRAGPSSRAATSLSRKSRKKKAPPPLQKISPDQPVIITLDSFGSSHGTEIRHLKDYLHEEAEAKREIDLPTGNLKGLTAKGIPEQTNFCDCGVYLIGYIEKFIADPRGFVNKVLSRELDKKTDFANFDPNAKRADIREQLATLGKAQEEEKRAKKKEANKAKAPANEIPKPSAQALDKPVANNVVVVPKSAKDPAPPGHGTARQVPASAAKSGRQKSPQSAPPAEIEDSLEIAEPRPLITSETMPASPKRTAASTQAAEHEFGDFDNPADSSSDEMLDDDAGTEVEALKRLPSQMDGQVDSPKNHKGLDDAVAAAQTDSARKRTQVTPFKAADQTHGGKAHVEGDLLDNILSGLSQDVGVSAGGQPEALDGTVNSDDDSPEFIGMKHHYSAQPSQEKVQSGSSPSPPLQRKGKHTVFDD